MPAVGIDLVILPVEGINDEVDKGFEPGIPGAGKLGAAGPPIPGPAPLNIEAIWNICRRLSGFDLGKSLPSEQL